MMKWLHHYLGIWIIKYSKVQLKSGLSEGELVMWMRAVMGLGLVCAVKQETQLESGECASTRAGRVWIWAMVKCLFVLHWCILGSFNFVTQLLSIVPFVGLEVPVYVCVCVCARSVVSYSFVTLWTVACQALLSMEFSRQEYWVASSWPRDRAAARRGTWGGEKAGKDEEMIPVNSEGPEEKHPVSFLLSNPWCPLFPVSGVSSFRAELYVPCNTWLRFESRFILRLSCRPCFIIIIPYTCLDLLPCEVGWPAVLGADGFPRVRVAC